VREEKRGKEGEGEMRRGEGKSQKEIIQQREKVSHRRTEGRTKTKHHRTATWSTQHN